MTKANVPPTVPSDPVWMQIARREVGVREIAGREAHPRILEYFDSTALATHPLGESDETPWCSAFACWVMEAAGIRSPRSAAARDWLRWGDPLLTPRRGCVVVFWRGTPEGKSGHVAFYDQLLPPTGKSLLVLGGNQAPGSGSVCIAPYERVRLLGYRWPKGVPVSHRR